VTVVLWIIFFKKPLLKRLTVLHGTLPKNVDGNGFTRSKYRENTLFYLLNRFLEVFLKVQTSWQ